MKRRVEVWHDLRTDHRYNHTRAFINFLKRQGDKVRVLAARPGSIDIEVTYHQRAETDDDFLSRFL